MFENLFPYPRVLARHDGGPLAEERRSYLDHRAAQGTPKSTLLRYATELLVVAWSLELKPRQPIGPGQIQGAARRWAGRQRRLWACHRTSLVSKTLRPGGHGLAQVPGLAGAKAQAGTSIRSASSTVGGGAAGSGRFITSNHRQVHLVGAAVFAA